MVLKNFNDVTFEISNIDALGLGLDTSLKIDVFDFDLASYDETWESAFVDLNLFFGGASFDLDVFLQGLSLGAVSSFEYVVDTTTEITQIGGQSRADLFADFQPDNYTIHLEGPSAGSVALGVDLFIGSAGLTLDFWGPDYSKSTIPISYQNPELFKIEHLGDSFELGEFHFDFNLPSGTTSTESKSTPFGGAAVGTTHETVLSLGSNVIELLSDIPALKALDLLEEDEIPLGWSELEYTIFGVPFSGNLDLVQQVTFVPDLVNMFFDPVDGSSQLFSDETLYYNSGSSFDLNYQYVMGGQFYFDYYLRPSFEFGVEVLSATITDGDHDVQFSAGPIYEWSKNFHSANSANWFPISVGELVQSVELRSEVVQLNHTFGASSGSSNSGGSATDTNNGTNEGSSGSGGTGGSGNSGGSNSSGADYGNSFSQASEYGLNFSYDDNTVGGTGDPYDVFRIDPTHDGEWSISINDISGRMGGLVYRYDNGKWLKTGDGFDNVTNASLTVDVTGGETYSLSLYPNNASQSSYKIDYSFSESGQGGGGAADRKPDLVIVDATIDDRTLEPGDRVRVEWEVLNQGDAAAGESEVGIYLSRNSTISLSDELLDQNATRSLAPGGRDTDESDSFYLPSDLDPGTYYIGLIADHLEEVSESSGRNNNDQKFQITVSAPDPSARLPDLMITNASISGTQFIPGERVEVEWEVLNQSANDASSTEVGVYLSGNDTISRSDLRVDYNSTKGLDAWETDTGENDSFLLPEDLPAGRYWVGLIADDLNEVHESNEDNNDIVKFGIEVTRTLTPTDLVIANAGISGHAFNVGDDIRVTWEVHNLGRSSPQTSEVGVYLSTDTLFNSSDLRLDYNTNGAFDALEVDRNESDTITVPDNLPTGTYYVGLVADDLNEIAEANEQNNDDVYFAVQITGKEPEPLFGWVTSVESSWNLDWQKGWNYGWHQASWEHGWHVGWQYGWNVGWNVGWYFDGAQWTIGWNFGWNVGWYHGWGLGWHSVGWALGWHVGWFYGWGLSDNEVTTWEQIGFT